MRPQRIAVIHCASCTGKLRRLDRGYLARFHTGELNIHGTRRIKDSRGFVVDGVPAWHCPVHGELDVNGEDTQRMAELAIEAHRRTGRVQHLAIPPKVRAAPDQ